MEIKIEKPTYKVVNGKYTAFKSMLVVEGRVMFIAEQEKPLFYVNFHNGSSEVGKLHANFVKLLPHPNDKKAMAKLRKLGESKGRAFGMEEGGWKGYVPLIISETEPTIGCESLIMRVFDKAIMVENVNTDNRKGEEFYKVLAMPEQLSLRHLLMFELAGTVEAATKKVELDCVSQVKYHFNEPSQIETTEELTLVQFDRDGKVSIHFPESRTFSKEFVQQALHKFASDQTCIRCRAELDISNALIDEWFTNYLNNLENGTKAIN